MPNHNDYHSYKNTSPKGGGSGGGGGCLPPIIIIGIIIAILYLIGKSNG